jgi:hypothetical protein
MVTPGSESHIPIGVYRGRGCGVPAVQAYETFLGKTVSFVLDYAMESPATWAQFEACNLTSANDVSAWPSQLGGRQLVLGLSACVLGSTWVTEQGGNDGHWTALGNRLISLGLGGATLRIGREFNGSWYSWKVIEGGQAAYIAGYSHIVNLLKSLPGANFRFMWNPYIGVGNLTTTGTESCYPGDSVVDSIGIDIYDSDSTGTNYPPGETIRTTAQQQAVWTKFLTEWDGLNGWLNLASSHHKPLAFPEWGLRLWNDAGIYRGGGDDPLFINEMAGYIKDNGIAMHAFWEDPWGAGVCDPDDTPTRLIDVPNSRQTFLLHFAG